MPAPTDLNTATIMDADEMRRAWTRIAHEVLEKNRGVQDLVIVGILRKGGPLARRLAETIERIEGTPVPCGVLDISLYRDDFRTYQPHVGTTQIPFDIEGKRLVLVDDVAFTGRTVRAAPRRTGRLRPPRRYPACRLSGPRPPRAAHPPGLRRQEPFRRASVSSSKFFCKSWTAKTKWSFTKKYQAKRRGYECQKGPGPRA